ncbi:(deoxy)nucleoside triphosphate pyrophosphohydrolase [Enterococcus sp. 2201sp1_2201st1_B8_2201SCRN_220225]|uniref:(deoxy)nucleoside triphosphate pyrophosphohydrolase n=1 Tax=unclassified Enterococcus TaxID=2608891 RepID=UPI0034A1E371
MTKQIEVVGAILVHKGKILCCKRGPGRSLAYLWEFPGGKIEAGETPLDALGRELREELKIEVSIQREVFEEASYDYAFGRVNMKTMVCHLKKGEPILTEHIALKWVAPSELGELEWAPVDIPTVKKLVAQGNVYD